MARLAPLGLAYFIVAALALVFTRFEGEFAFLWGASAILIAALIRLPRRQRTATLALCGMSSFMATGLWGLGWAAAPFAVLVNLSEGVVGAWLMRRDRAAGRALESLDWMVRFILVAGIAAPLSAGTLAAAWLAVNGHPVLKPFLNFFYSHGLGNLTFTPIAMLVMGQRARQATWKALHRRRRDAGILLSLLVITTLTVFWQQRMPLLFLPVLPVMLIAYRTGREGAALSVAVLAVLGGAMSAAGWGPIQLIKGSPGLRVFFFQFYLATTVLTILPVAADLQRRRLLARRIRDSEARYRLLADYATDIIFKLEARGRIRYVSPAIRRFGYAPEELVGRNCSMLIDPLHLPDAIAAHLKTVALAGETHRFEYLAIAKDGSRHWCETHARMIVDKSGQVDGMVSIVRNIDERKRQETTLAHAALTDPLTGLPNRRAFRETAGALSNDRRAVQGSCIALFDIDHFKRVNDTHGHDAGDEVLRIFARIATSALRKDDVVSRIGGEEFAIIFPGTSVDQALIICDRLRTEVGRTPICIGDRIIRVTVSGGVAELGPGGLDDALKQADRALYQAKDGGRDQLALAA